MTVPKAPTLSLILTASPIGFQMLRAYLSAAHSVTRSEEDGGKVVDGEGIGKNVITFHFQGTPENLDHLLKDGHVRSFVKDAR